MSAAVVVAGAVEPAVVALAGDVDDQGVALPFADGLAHPAYRPGRARVFEQQPLRTAPANS